MQTFISVILNIMVCVYQNVTMKFRDNNTKIFLKKASSMYIMPTFCLCWIHVLSKQPDNGNIRIVTDVVDRRFGYEYG